jgi:hypothetical protein
MTAGRRLKKVNYMKKKPAAKKEVEAPSTPLTFAEAMRQMNWGAESEISPEDSKKTLPSTFAELARQRNWGVGDQAMKPDPNTDRYFITTTGTTDPNWTPGEEDWKRLAEMFRGR